MLPLEQSERFPTKFCKDDAKRRVFGIPWLVSGSEKRFQSSSPAHRLTKSINDRIFSKVPFKQERGQGRSCCRNSAIRQPMSARLSGVQAARSIEFHVDSDLERVPPGWPQILPEYMKYSPVASESCAWSKSRPLDP